MKWMTSYNSFQIFYMNLLLSIGRILIFDKDTKLFQDSVEISCICASKKSELFSPSSELSLVKDSLLLIHGVCYCFVFGKTSSKRI